MQLLDDFVTTRYNILLFDLQQQKKKAVQEGTIAAAVGAESVYTTATDVTPDISLATATAAAASLPNPAAVSLPNPAAAASPLNSPKPVHEKGTSGKLYPKGQLPEWEQKGWLYDQRKNMSSKEIEEGRNIAFYMYGTWGQLTPGWKVKYPVSNPPSKHDLVPMTLEEIKEAGI